jgi:hypothetical protein
MRKKTPKTIPSRMRSIRDQTVRLLQDARGATSPLLKKEKDEN